MTKKTLWSLFLSLILLISLSIEPFAKERGLTISYTGDYFHNTQGGIRTGDTYLDLIQAEGFTQFELTSNWTITLSASGLITNGNSLSEDIVGDVQVASNLEGGGRFTKLATAGIELENESASYYLGLYDINSEFDVLDSSGLFINSAHGIGSAIALTGENGPSIYPFYSLAFRGEWQLDGNQLIRAAIMDGVPGSTRSNNATNIELTSDEGYFSIIEYQRVFDDAKLLIGGWQYSQSQKLNSPENAPSESGNFGFYARLESNLHNENTKGFVRIGHANDKFNQYDWYIGAGIAHTGVFADSQDDSIGIALAYLRNDLASELAQKSHETNLEITYQYPFSEAVSLQPNIQYILNPGAVYSDALIVGLRLSLSYDF